MSRGRIDIKLVAVAELFRVERVLGAGPFREIGRPRVLDVSPGGRLAVVGGELPVPSWNGRWLGSTGHRLAVYRTADLACVHLLATRHPVNAVACHPTLPVAAVGTGAYDGGFLYKGELLLLNLVTGVTVSAFAGSREVREVSWRDPRTLDLVFSIAHDNEFSAHGSTSLTYAIRRADWDRVPDASIEVPALAYPVADRDRGTGDVAAAEVARLSGEHGRAWVPRLAVAAVEALPDGRILAALDGVRLECWPPTGADPMWRLAGDGSGCQIKVLPGDRAALALTQPRPVFADRRLTISPSLVTEVDIDSGTVSRVEEPGFPAVLAARSDGTWAVRDMEGWTHVHRPDGARTTTAGLGRYNPFRHHFDVRRAPDLLFARDDWVVALDAATGDQRRLFPHRGLSGGYGAHLGDAIVHTGRFCDERGTPTRPGSFVVRRAYPAGQVQWQFETEEHADATALDVADGLVFVTYLTGELLILDATDGSVRARPEILVEGRRVVPLSLAHTGRGRLAIGTLDGLILDGSVVPASARPG